METLPGKRIEANGLSFHVVDEGSGDPVVLLHGFPDSSYLWRNQIPVLAGAGFRVIAPDLRGFGQSDKPKDEESYLLPVLAQDVAEIMTALDVPRAHVVGHDWGAALAWTFASFLPDRVDRLVTLSVGHPASFAGAGIQQLARSWYMWLFQFRGVAEELIRRDDFRFIREWLAGTGDQQQYVDALSDPEALTAGLNWYRANVSPEAIVTGPPAFPPVQAATLGVWGRFDIALTEEQMTGSAEFVAGPWRYERFDDAAHWLMLEQPEKLNELLLEFLSSP